MSTTVIVLGVLLVIVIVYMLFQDYFSDKTKMTNETHLKTDSPSNVQANDLTKRDATNVTYSIWVYVNQAYDGSKNIFERENDTVLYLDTGAVLKCDIGSTPETITITNNFPLQKYVFVLISIDSKIVDVYLDGKLMKSIQLNDTLQAADIEDKSLVYGSGFDAYIAKFERVPEPTDPMGAWNKYMEGNGGSSLTRALGNYNVNLSVLKDNIETSKFALF
jgi:hypothetical protein